MHVLDAGCGTGNYTKALIKHGVDKVTLLDACAEMLNKARDKLRDAIDQKVIENIVEAKMPPLPFDDGSFDVVLFSAVSYVTYINNDQAILFSEVNDVTS